MSFFLFFSPQNGQSTAEDGVTPGVKVREDEQPKKTTKTVVVAHSLLFLFSKGEVCWVRKHARTLLSYPIGQ